MKIDKDFLLEMADFGEGMNDLPTGNSVGFMLIKSLVQQLDGDLSIALVDGVSYRISFPDITVGSARVTQ